MIADLIWYSTPGPNSLCGEQGEVCNFMMVLTLSSRIILQSPSTPKKALKCRSVRFSHLPFFGATSDKESGYIVENGQPRLPPGMRELLHEDLNKSFEF
jgi:hypothetical protein